jgi:hypothetical protein
MNLNILNEIDIEQNHSEINVLYSICESYNKMIQIMTETNNDSIIQECVVFQEADTVKTDDKKSIKDYFLSILSKVFNAIRTLLTKIIEDALEELKRLIEAKAKKNEKNEEENDELVTTLLKQIASGSIPTTTSDSSPEA